MEIRAKQKLSTIQKRENLNYIYRIGDVGPGGAYHEYDLYFAPKSEEEPKEGIYAETFLLQKGPRKEPNAQHGIIDTDLLEIVRDRLKCFQSGEFATRENAIALTHIEEALLWMNRRVEDRIERNVLGTYNK
jgi:hypothetical protein